MEELLKNEMVRMKIKSLSAPVRKAFIENLLDLYEQEAEEMIDVIEESRMELRGDFSTFNNESTSLRAESRMFEDRRKEYDSECVDKYMQRKNMSSGMSSRHSASSLAYVDEETNNKAIKDYVKKRGKRGPPLADVIRSRSTDPLGGRADSVMSTRSLPTPVASRTVEEEKEAVMKNLTSARLQNEAERQRQANLIAQRREKRRQDKKTTEEKALELLEKALAMDKKLVEKKQEQDHKLKERVEDMKRKRAESRIGDRETTSLSTNEKSEDKNDKQKTSDRKSEKSDKSRSSDKSSSSDKRSSSDKSSEKSSDKSKSSDTSDKSKSSDRSSDKSKSSERSKSSDRSSDKRSSDKKDKQYESKSDKKRESGKSDKSEKKEKVTGDYDFAIY